MRLGDNFCPQNEISFGLWNREPAFATFHRLIIQRNFGDVAMKAHGEFVPRKLGKTLATRGSPDDQLRAAPTERKFRQ